MSDQFLTITLVKKGFTLWRKINVFEVKRLSLRAQPWCGSARGNDCGWALARAHARAGQPSLIASYLGKGDQFDEAVADFATPYARQNERDFEALVRAARQGRIEVYTES
jgi:hypothetical protein